MKRVLLLFVVSLIVASSFGQSSKSKVELLYFKANLACCKAKACNALETDIQNIILKNYPDSSVVLTEIKLLDEASKPLIEKFNAQSQTVVIIKKKKKKETYFDVSDIVKNYVQNQNKEAFEKVLVSKINELKKK